MASTFSPPPPPHLLSPPRPPPRIYNDPSGLIPSHIIQPPPPPARASTPPPTNLSQSYTHGTSLLTPSSLRTPHRTHLLGSPLAHSLAPLLHNTLFFSASVPWKYTALETVDLGKTEDVLRAEGCAGVAVTMPLKVAAVGLCDELSPEARACGAVNTIYLRRGRDGRRVKVGANTDVIGIREAMLRAAPSALPLSKTANGVGATSGLRTDETRERVGMVIGGGGAARTAVYALWRHLGCGLIYIVCRDQTEVEALTSWYRTARPGAERFGAELVHIQTVAQARRWEAPDLIVGTVPDFEPTTAEEVSAREVVVEFLTKGERRGEGEWDEDEVWEGGEGGREKGLVLEMCYHPRVETGFYRLCEGAGWRVVPGTEAMVWQGVEQQILWLEREIGEAEVQRAREVVLRAVRARGGGRVA
ncbi:MAG: hypothetical protein MMC23_001655 [Stictis urceolatum]|nr:hypothetical protein [Stictis urceolata]